MRIRYGKRAHGIGGFIREVSVGDDRLSLSWMTAYDHREALDTGHPHAVLSFTLPWTGYSYALGFLKGCDYARLYVGFGELLISLPDEGEFDAIYGDGERSPG